MIAPRSPPRQAAPARSDPGPRVRTAGPARRGQPALRVGPRPPGPDLNRGSRPPEPARTPPESAESLPAIRRRIAPPRFGGRGPRQPHRLARSRAATRTLEARPGAHGVGRPGVGCTCACDRGPAGPGILRAESESAGLTRGPARLGPGPPGGGEATAVPGRGGAAGQPARRSPRPRRRGRRQRHGAAPGARALRAAPA
jgi:hypothetical protein